MPNAAEVKIIDGTEEPRTLQGQKQDTGPKVMHEHKHMMMHRDASSETSSLSSGSLSSDSLSSGESISSGSSSGSSFSGFSNSNSSSLSSGVSDSSGSSGSGDSSTSFSLSSGSFSDSLSSGSSGSSGSAHQKNDRSGNNPDNPKMNDDGFAVPGHFRKHRKHHSHSSESSFSESLSSGSSGSLSSDSSGSVDASSNVEAERTQDTGEPKHKHMMMRGRFEKKKNELIDHRPIPGLAKELKHYIAEVNMQVPDRKGQAPVDTTAPDPSPTNTVLSPQETSLQQAQMNQEVQMKMMKKAQSKMKKKKNTMGGMNMSKSSSMKKKKMSKKMQMSKQMMQQKMMQQMMMTQMMSSMMPTMMEKMMPEKMMPEKMMPDKMSKSMSEKKMSDMMKEKMMKEMMGGGPGGMDMKKMSKSKPMMPQGSMSPMMPTPKSKSKQQWTLVTFTNNEGCQCFSADQAPSPNASNIASTRKFRTQAECEAQQTNSGCQTRCQRINNTLVKLREFINVHELHNDQTQTQALLDAKELMLVLQTRYVVACSDQQIRLGRLEPPLVNVDEPYVGRIQIHGGTPPYTALAVGGLPEGFTASVQGNAIVIRGRIAPGKLQQTIILEDDISVSIQDRSGNHGQKGYTLKISSGAASSRSSKSSKSSQSSQSSKGSRSSANSRIGSSSFRSSKFSSSTASSSLTASGTLASSSPANSLSGEAGLFSSQAGGSLIGAGTAHTQFKLLTRDRNPSKTNEMLAKSLSWWWPSPTEVIDKMFKVAKLKKGEVVYDLGCGDGRIPIQAAEKWGATGVGVDFDENLVKQAKKRAIKHKVDNKVEIRHGDALKVKDIHKADVVCLYILDRGMKIMKPMLQSKLKKGTRIVSHNYKFKDWKPTKELVTTDKEGHKHWIYLYVV